MTKRRGGVAARSHAGSLGRGNLPRCNAARAAKAVRPAVRAGAEIQVLQAASLERAKPTEVTGVILPPAPKGNGCPRYVRRRVAARLPELCEALIDQAMAGDLQAAKLLWQMAELDKAPATAAPGRTKTAAGFAQKALAEFRAR